jgi:hypothetical protein
MNTLKQDFLYNEIWLLSFGGAFQHVRIYKPNVKEKDKTAFRQALKVFISEHILPQYKKKVGEMAHVLNIEAIRAASEDWSKILNGNKLNVGASQKLLNLLLKYLWCLNEAATPPHCPLDRIIQQKGLISNSPVNWTTLNDMDDYLHIMHKIKQAANEKGQSIAEWELTLFNRR